MATMIAHNTLTLPLYPGCEIREPIFRTERVGKPLCRGKFNTVKASKESSIELDLEDLLDELGADEPETEAPVAPIIKL